MELSVRDAKARLSQALDAAARGERVIVTRHGKPYAEIRSAEQGGPIDWDALDAHRKKMGWDKVEWEWPAEFDDPAFSREVLGLDG